MVDRRRKRLFTFLLLVTTVPVLSVHKLIKKIDKNDYFSQLISTGNDLVGAVTVKELQDE